MLKKTVAVIAILAVLGVGVAWLWQQRAAQTAAQAPTETAVVRRDALQIEVGAAGSVVPANEVTLSFASGGRVADVLAKVGDVVDEGQPIAVLDTRDLMLQMATARGNRDAATGGLAGARTGVSAVRAGPSQIQIDAAKVKIDRAKDSLWGAQAQRDAICGRAENKMVPQADCDSAEASVLQAQDGVRLAELDLQDATDGAAAVDVAAAQNKVTQAQGQLTASQAQVDQARFRLEQATLVSPAAGTVTALNLKVGEQIGAGQPAATVSDLEQLEVEVLLDQNDIARVVVGQSAEVVMDAFLDSPLTGEVVRVASVGETQAGVVLYPVAVRLAPTELAVRPGMTANVTVVTERKDGVLLVPRRAVQSIAGKQFVDVVEGGTTRQTEVQLGATTDTDAEVLSGITDGDVVAVPTARTPARSGLGGPLGGGR
jgi:HlyD family secretion protein